MKYILAILLLVPGFSAHAEIFRGAQPCENSEKLCQFWWPILSRVKGWDQDRGSSYRYSINAQVPAGSTFADAQAIIYAKAVFKPRQPESKDLAGFIKNDQAGFASADPALKIEKLPSLKSRDGRVFQRYSFTPSGEGHWEQVTYGEETDRHGNAYYLTFVISARDETALRKYLPAYEQFITGYQ